LGEWNIVVPARHDRDARRAAPNRQLSLPPSNITPCAGQTLAAPAIAEPADAAYHRRLERRGGVHAVLRRVARSGLEEFAEAQAGVAHGDDDDATPEAPRP